MSRDLSDRYEVLSFVRDAHDDISVLLTAWLDARHGAPVPKRSDMLPENFISVLPSIWLYRYDADIGDFVCRLAGEQINNAWGRSLGGVRFRDVVGNSAHGKALRRWTTILNTPSIQYGRIFGSPPPQEDVIAERLVLPLSDGDGTVCYTIGLSVYPYRQDDRDRTPPVWDNVIVTPCADIP